MPLKVRSSSKQILLRFALLGLQVTSNSTRLIHCLCQHLISNLQLDC